MPFSASLRALSCPSESTLIYATGGLWSEHTDVARVDSTVYVAVVGGIQVFSVKDTAHPHRVGFVHSRNHTLRVAADGTRLAGYTWAGPDITSLQLYSLEDPHNPTLLSNTPLPNEARSIALFGERVIIVSNVLLYPDSLLSPFETRLDIYDVSDLAHPQLMSTCDLPGGGIIGLMGPVLYGENLIVPAGRLFVVNLHDPLNPFVVTSTFPGLDATGVIVRDSLFYVLEETGTWPATFSVFSTYKYGGDSLHLLSNFQVDGAVWSIANVGTTFLIAAGVSGTLVIDESDPTNPTLVACLPPSGRAIRSATMGQYAVTVHESAVIPFTSNHPPDEYPDLRCEEFDPNYPHSYSGHWNNEGDIVVTDLSNPYAPVEVGRYENPGYIQHVGSHLSYVVAIGDDSSLYFLSSTADSLEPVASLRLGNVPTSIASQDSLLYIGEHYGMEIALVDGVNPPQLLGHLALPRAYSGAIAVRGQYVFMCCDSALMVIDVSDPAQPKQVGRSTSIAFAYDVVIRGNYAFVCDVWDGVAVLDISQPNLPQEVARYPRGWSLDLALRDTLLLVGDGNTMDIVDISNPIAPVRIGGWSGNEIRGICWAGNDAAVADLDGVTLLSLADPTSPRQLCCYNSPGYKMDVAAMGDTIYVASYLGVERLLQPTATYVTNETHLGLPSTLHLGNPYPNPFNATVTIPFTVEKRQRVTIDVCNVLGQKVSTLLDKEMPAGVHQVQWSISNVTSITAASSIYIVRLSNQSRTESRGVVLLK